MKPFAGDIESFTLINASGEAVHCSRTQNRELFRLAIGGFGLFGVIARVQLRLQRRRKLQRRVKLIAREALMPAFEESIRAGALYGDFQFAVDEHSPDFLRRGVFSSYHAVEDTVPISAPKQLSEKEWLSLLRLAYTDRSEGFRHYTQHYLDTDGQTYWSDTHQLSPYLPRYATELTGISPNQPRSTLLISELFVPRPLLATFLRQAADVLRAGRVPLIYGTIRLIQQDEDSFLVWAKKPYACIIFNLLTPHTPTGQAASRSVFMDLIDLATSMSGSFYLTYHRYADRARVERCYPEFASFLALKNHYDPDCRFQSDWWRSYTAV